MKNIIINFIRDLLKYIEILICIRKKFNKTYTFPKNPQLFHSILGRENNSALDV